jgi:hypothetical protein
MRRCHAMFGLALAVLTAGCAVRPSYGPSVARSEGGGLAASRAWRAEASGRAGLNQGGAWEVVLPGAGVGGVASGLEQTRRDAALAYRPAESVLEQTRYPEPMAPRLDQLRYRFLSDNPRQMYYYGERSWDWWWGWR